MVAAELLRSARPARPARLRRFPPQRTAQVDQLLVDDADATGVDGAAVPQDIIDRHWSVSAPHRPLVKLFDPRRTDDADATGVDGGCISALCSLMQVSASHETDSINVLAMVEEDPEAQAMADEEFADVFETDLGSYIDYEPVELDWDGTVPKGAFSGAYKCTPAEDQFLDGEILTWREADLVFRQRRPGLFAAACFSVPFLKISLGFLHSPVALDPVQRSAAWRWRPAPP